LRIEAALLRHAEKLYSVAEPKERRYFVPLRRPTIATSLRKDRPSL
jgi:hypothetical protein